MNILNFLGITLVEILTILVLIIALILLSRGKVKAGMCLVATVLALNVLGNWNTWFTLFLLISK